MSRKRSTVLIGMFVVAAMGLVAPAQAFNPQPDPPARGVKNSDKTLIYNGNSLQPGNPGLLNSGAGFSTHGPLFLQTPLGGGGSHGARPGGVGIR